MRRGWIVAPLIFAAPAASAQLSSAALEQAVARPPANARLPAALSFLDGNGQATTLAAVAGGRPLVLLFADYTCRHICGPGLTLTAGALHDSGLVAGRDYRVAVIGIDPKDGAADARAMAARLAGMPDVARATTLLRGSAGTIAAATRALGYGAVYDPASDQFAHDASVYLFAADGRLAALVPEIGLRPEALRAGLTGGAPAPGFGQRLAHLCYGLDALAGRYDGAIVVVLRGLALLAIVGGAMLVLRARRRDAA